MDGAGVHSSMHMTYTCDGTPSGPGGAWAGHVLPGTLFIALAAHWLQGSMRQWFACKRAGVPYTSRGYYSWPGLPNWPIEGVVKILMSVLGGVLEVTWHGDGYQNLICYPGTKRAGHFHGEHLNNWQHLQMYMCFAMSGLLDIIAYSGALPVGTEKVGLVLAFAGETLLMGLHSKEEALDKFVHLALTWFMVFCVVACACEVAFPHNYLASCARSAGVMLQGVWFIITAHIMFHDPHPAWNVAGGDLGPFSWAKIVMVQTITAILAGYVGLHVAVIVRMNRSQ